MNHRQILDLLDHTFAVELDRRRRIRWVNRAVAKLEGQDPASYCDCRPEELWAVREECGAAYHECLRRQAVLTGYEVWRGRGDAQRIVRVVRLPTQGGVLIVGEDVTSALQRAALRALEGFVPSRPIRNDIVGCLAAGMSLNDCCNALAVDIDVALLTVARLLGGY